MGNTAQGISSDIQTQTGQQIDPKFFEQVAQFAHFGMMFAVTTVCADLSYKLGHKWIGLIVGLVGCAIYAALHEFWYDPRYEDAVTRGSDMMDFLFLMLGAVSAGLVYRFLVL
jgi:VanZ family protein